MGIHFAAFLIVDREEEEKDSDEECFKSGMDFWSDAGRPAISCAC